MTKPLVFFIILKKQDKKVGEIIRGYAPLRLKMLYENTINKILTRLSKETPLAEIGDLLETKKTLYPDANIKREDKNIIVDSKEMTVPLACSKEWKKTLIRDKAPLREIYLEFDRGDILVVKKILKNKVIVENISIEEEFRKDFAIDKIEIAKKNFVLIRRKSIELLRSLETINEKTKLKEDGELK